MIKLFQKSETDKYIIIKILFIQISFKKKPPKSDIDAIVWWVPFKNLRNAVRNIYFNIHNRFNDLQYQIYYTQREIHISRQLYSKLNENQNLNNIYLVSVIITVYDIGEKYLRHCLESIVNQTYKNIEIILVNDCSNFEEDETVCLEYASKHKRIKYIKHKENMGDGASRMTGLKEAKGYSVLFMDGDDYAAANLLEISVCEMIKNDADIVCYSFFIVRETNNRVEFNNSYFKDIPYQVLYGEDIMDLFCNDIGYISGHLWNKLFKREVLLELGFNNMLARYKTKDLNYVFKVFLNAKSVLYIPLNLYFYIECRNNSIVNINKFKDSYFLDMYYIFSDMFDYLNKESNEKITKLFGQQCLWLYYEAVNFDKAGVREENHFINVFKKLVIDLIEYGAVDRYKLLENMKNITNDANLINLLTEILSDENINKSFNMKLWGGGKRY